MYILLLIISSFSLNSHADGLQQGAKPIFMYSKVRIEKIRSVKVEAPYIPENSHSVAFYKGKAIVSIDVQANLCLSDSKTFGLLEEVDNQVRTLELIAGYRRPRTADGCAQWGGTRTIIVEQEINVPAFKDQTVEFTYIFPMGRDQTKIHFTENNEHQLEAVMTLE